MVHIYRPVKIFFCLDKNIFGVPLLVMAERTGNPLPHPVLLVLNHLTRLSIDSVGIFRKSGMKSRIEKLRNQMENTPDKVSFDEYSVYDIADTLKQYFRELPEPLLTTKLVDTFISIHKGKHTQFFKYESNSESNIIMIGARGDLLFIYNLINEKL